MDSITSNRNETATTPNPSPPDLAATNASIHLQVGERRFTTTRSTLTEESGFFGALLSGRWDNALADGSYFIDADPALFEHILAYLRRGVFPLFFSTATGHDYHRYLSLLEEARYFQIPRLEAWLEGKRYVKAVKVSVTAEEYDEYSHDWRYMTESADTTLEYHQQQTVKKVHLCPHGIADHRGSPEYCQRWCDYTLGDKNNRFAEESCRWTLVVRREVVFDSDVCLGREEDKLNRANEVSSSQGDSGYSNQPTSFDESDWSALST